MKQQTTVNQAITRGHLMVNVPAIITIIGLPALCIFLSDRNIIPKWCVAAGFIGGIVSAWLIWSVMITKWRIWAFENVDNVHDLKRRAIAEKLIWNDGNFFEKTEIRSAAEKIRLSDLEKKFALPDVFSEDHSIPKRTEIYYSKGNNYFEIGFSVLLICSGPYLISLLDTKSIFLGSLSILFGIYYGYKAYKKVNDKNPQIILDNNGIRTGATKFKEWSVIYDEQVIREGYGSSSSTYFQYYYDDGEKEKVLIDTLDVSHRSLENLIRTYRFRYDKNG